MFAVGALMADPISSGYKKQQSNFINSQTHRYMLFNITLSLGTAAKHMLTPFIHSHVSNPWPSQTVWSSNQRETTKSGFHQAQPKIQNIMTHCAQVSACKYQFRSLEDHLFTIIRYAEKKPRHVKFGVRKWKMMRKNRF